MPDGFPEEMFEMGSQELSTVSVPTLHRHLQNTRYQHIKDDRRL